MSATQFGSSLRHGQDKSLTGCLARSERHPTARAIRCYPGQTALPVAQHKSKLARPGRAGSHAVSALPDGNEVTLDLGFHLDSRRLASELVAVFHAQRPPIRKLSDWRHGLNGSLAVSSGPAASRAPEARVRK